MTLLLASVDVKHPVCVAKCDHEPNGRTDKPTVLDMRGRIETAISKRELGLKIKFKRKPENSDKVISPLAKTFQNISK